MMKTVLSYRHAYHAGNHADVVKHLVLGFCLVHLNRKETPYRYIDTHAGSGAFDLSRGFTAEHEEWKAGVERLRAFRAQSGSLAAPDSVDAYLRIVDGFRSIQGPDAYPGSPAIAVGLMRPTDRAVLFELHPSDQRELSERFMGDERVQVRRTDGLAGLRSLLPPPSRRALVLVDPTYEVKNEHASVVDAISDALRRFATGTYVVWYPLLEREEIRSLPERLLGLHAGSCCRAELTVKTPREDGRGMCGSGLVVLNPPWTLRTALEECLPYLARALGEDGAGRSRLDWMEK